MVWPALRNFSASIWVGLALSLVTWLVAALVIWKEAPLLMRFAVAGTKPSLLTEAALATCRGLRIMYPAFVLFLAILPLFGTRKEREEFQRLGSNRWLGPVLVVVNVALTALIIYSVLLLPLL